MEIPDSSNVILNRPRLPGVILRRLLRLKGASAERLFGNVDLIHSNGHFAPELNGCPLVFTAFDATVYLYPEYHTAANYEFVNRNLHRAARQAAHIVTVSERSRLDLQRFLHIPDDRISVVYGAAGERFKPGIHHAEIERVKRAHGITGDYVLTVGTTEPRKNLNRLVMAMKGVAARGHKHLLVIVGPRGWLSDPLYKLVDSEGMANRVLFTGYVHSDDLVRLYSGATLFCYPSIYEGFGLPVVEAMACGIPTITSNSSALAEVAGDGARLIDPESREQIEEALCELLESKSLRDSLSERGLERSRNFSWEASAHRLLDIYRRTLSALA